MKCNSLKKAASIIFCVGLATFPRHQLGLLTDLECSVFRWLEEAVYHSFREYGVHVACLNQTRLASCCQKQRALKRKKKCFVAVSFTEGLRCIVISCIPFSVFFFLLFAILNIILFLFLSLVLFFHSG